MARIHLIGWSNSAGLSRDIAVLQDVLAQAGHQITLDGTEHPGRLRRLWHRTRSGGFPWDLTLFVERVVPAWMTLSPRNVLIPNPEWMQDGPYVRRLDAIWSKTGSAMSALQRLGVPTFEIGFTTPDRRLAWNGRTEPVDWRAALHVAGDNPTKGTLGLVELWQRHPEWPLLTIVTRGKRVVLPPELPPNINLICRFVPDQELAALQARCGLHFCLSEVEGFGHTLAEAQSLGVVVVTVDAPPMNEIVTPERGVLVPATPFAPMRLGYRYRFDSGALEGQVDRLLGSSQEDLAALGEAGRTWFETNDRAFRQRLIGAVQAVLAGRP